MKDQDKQMREGQTARDRYDAQMDVLEDKSESVSF